MSTSVRVHDLADLSDVAMAASDVHVFRRGLFEVLKRFVPYDRVHAFCCTSLEDPAPLPTAENWRVLAHGEGPRFMADMSKRVGPAWLRAALDGEIDLAQACCAPEVRDSLVVEQFVLAYKVRSCVLYTWSNRYGFFGIVSGAQAANARLKSSVRTTLDQLLPVIQGAEAMFRSRQEPLSETQQARWASAVGLSARERQLVSLAVRGLTNSQIASVFGTSPFTIRNQLASIYRKACVGGRAELIHACATDCVDCVERARR